MAQASPQTVIASTGRRLEEFAALLNVKLAPLAESVGIDVQDLKRTDLRISLEGLMRLMQLLEIVTGDDCVGLRFAQHFQEGDSGAFGFALLHAPSLREALRIYRTYQPVLADQNFFEVTDQGPDVAIRWRYPRLIGNPDQYTDFRAGLLLKMLRRFLGANWMPRRVELMRARPRSTALHRDHFGSALSFGMTGSNAVIFPSAGLDTASGTDDPRLFDMMEAACRNALTSSDRGRDLRLQVAEHIVALLPLGEATLGNVAKAMVVGERSLQRRLGEMGTNFEKLLEQTRRDLSDRLIAGDTPLAEISYLCGYSNASAYSRAARSWYGMAPQAMRQRLRDGTT